MLDVFHTADIASQLVPMQSEMRERIVFFHGLCIYCCDEMFYLLMGLTRPRKRGAVVKISARRQNASID